MNFKEALKYSMDLCSRQERCRSEVMEKLAVHGLPEPDIEKVLRTLAAEKYIDESRYAGSYTRDKFRFNRWGKVRIRYMLEQKKIPGTLIESALDGIEEEEYRSVLKQELVKKRKTIKGVNAFDLRGKLFRFGRQRGFETGLIHSLLDEII
jgi:regulatory protein